MGRAAHVFRLSLSPEVAPGTACPGSGGASPVGSRLKDAAIASFAGGNPSGAEERRFQPLASLDLM